MVATTLVGSFPLEYSESNIRRALEDQVDLGVTFPVLPQLRDFVYMYVEPMISEGVVVQEGLGFRLKGDIEEVEPEPPEDILVAADIARELGVRFRVPVTGAFTIASKISLASGRVGDMSTSLLVNASTREGVVAYVKRLARKLHREVRGDVYCVDEPVLSVIVGSRSIMYGIKPEEVSSALDSILAELGGTYRGVHVCGKLPPLLKGILLKLQNANFLDHEHSDFPANRAYYTREELANSNKKLAYGIVSPVKPSVEREEEVLALAKDAVDRYGDTLLFFKPDCGFGGLRGFLKGREYEEIVLKKIRVLVSVAEKVDYGAVKT